MSVVQATTTVAQKHATAKMQAVVCYERGMAVYLWPMFLVPAVLAVLTSYGVIAGKTAVWWWLGTFVLVATALCWNLERARAIMLALLVGVLALGAYLGEAKDVPILSWLGSAMGGIPLNWTVEVQAVIYIIAVVSLFFFVVDWIDSRINGKWEFGKNEFEHFSLGRRDTSLARGQNTVVTRVPCTIKSWLMFGGATLDITGAVDQKSHANVMNVFRGNATGARIRKMMESFQVTEDHGGR